MTDLSLLAFTGGLLDRCANRRGDADWLQSLMRKPEAKFVTFRNDRIALSGKALALSAAHDGAEPVFLGRDEGGSPWFARAGEVPEPSIDLRSVAAEGYLPSSQLAMLAQARSLLHWHERHQYCANCGCKTEMRDGGYRRRCEACQSDHFPRTDPVVIIAVRRKDRLLLGRQAAWVPGMYSTLAGFMEPGETIEEAARREVLEESGIRVGGVSFVANQPWPFPASLMIGLIGEAVSDDITVDPKELETARWFEIAEIRMMLEGTHPEGLKVPPPLAIAHHLIVDCLHSARS